MQIHNIYRHKLMFNCNIKDQNVLNNNINKHNNEINISIRFKIRVLSELLNRYS